MSKSKNTTGVDEENYVPIEEDKLKEEQIAELEKATEISSNLSALPDLVKKFDFPSLQSLTEVQRENMMLDMVHRAVGHAFVNHAPVMTSSVHNAVIKTLYEKGYQGYTGPCYQQPGQMGFSSIGLATITSPLVAPKGSSSSAFPQTTGTTLPFQFPPIFTNSTTTAASAQGGFASGVLVGWDPITGFGMPPGSFAPSTLEQNNASASQPMNPQQNVSASQPIEQNVSAAQPTGQTSASASKPMAQQQPNASLIQPITPTEVLISRLPHQDGVNWVFHDPVMGMYGMST